LKYYIKLILDKAVGNYKSSIQMCNNDIKKTKLQNNLDKLNKIIGKILSNKDTSILKYIGGKLYKQNCDDFTNRYSNDPILKDKSYADLFDNNSDILLISNGFIIHLKTGDIRFKLKENYCTTYLHVEYNSCADGTVLNKLISDIMCGKEHIIKFLQLFLVIY
jgi:hypothetical protein